MYIVKPAQASTQQTVYLL